MTLLPVVGRELRVASRRRWSYWGRSLAAGVALLVVGWCLLVERGMSLNGIGKQVFGVTSFFAVVFAGFAGVVYSADAVASERRDGTLGLLFLTDLKGYDVLFGKLAASSLGCVFHLVACVPVMAIGILLGGVTGAEYVRMLLLMFNLLLCSLSLGMLGSTLSADSKRAAAITFFLLLCLAGGLPAIGGIIYWIGWKFDVPESVRDSWFEAFFAWANPVAPFVTAFDSEYRSDPSVYRSGMGFIAFVALIGLALAAFRLPRIWQEKAAAVARKGVMGRIEYWRWPTVEARHAWRTRLLQASPFVWLSGRHWMRGVSVWIFLFASAVLFGIFAVEIGKDFLEPPTFIATSVLVHLVLKVWMASEAPRQFHEDRRSGGMELLLSTPMTVEDFTEGRLRALRRQFEIPIFVVLVVDAIFLLSGTDWGKDADSGEWAIYWVARMILLPLDAYACAWTGMAVGMKARGNRTTGHVVLRILVIPWLVVVVVTTLGGLLALGGTNVFDGIGFKGMLVLWTLLGAGNDILWITSARTTLASFRQLATTRSEHKVGRAA